jgi:hypothetical protein
MVRDASGGVIEGAGVGLGPGAAVVSNAGGVYALCVRAGSTEVTVTATGYGGVTLWVHAQGRGERDGILVPEATFAGRVVRADDDSPVAHAIVGVWPAEFGRERPRPGTVTTDADG